MEFVDFNSLIFIFLSTFQVNGTAVISPVSSTLGQLFSQIMEVIPKVISAGIILIIGYIIGKVVGWVIKKVLEKMKFESTIQKTTLGETVSRSGWSVTKLFSTIASWFIYLFFIVAAVNTLQFTQLSEALSSIWLWIPNLIAFIVILVVGSIIADFVGNWIKKELVQRDVPAGQLISVGVKGILYTIIFVTAITQLQIGDDILNMVITAMVWGLAAAIAIGLGGVIISYS